ncbi:MAG: PEP-CTERM sorting domain-containing protein [Colwellia sp.]|nr:PEP-CTERM sorting domain-containing protein [Colwellia sp.]
MKTNKIFKTTTIAACLFATLSSVSVNASHFRGAAVVPTVDANGMLTIDAKSFWRRQVGTAAGTFPHSGVSGSSSLFVAGAGNAALGSISLDTSDIRRSRIDETFSIQLPPGAGTYTISWGSNAWVAGVPNGSGSYGTTSTIFWDGLTANTPIQFDLENIQQEVLRGAAYSDNLDAVGVGLTYDDTFLGTGMSGQAPGYSIDASGQINMSAATTTAILDNGSSPGADIGFSGKIGATDGSAVEFVWLFDAVDTGANLAPSITDVVINALVGTTIDHTLAVSDPNVGDILTTSFINFLGTGGNPLNSTFDPGTLDFSWDSTGFSVGTYIATFGTSDGSLSDQGTITINLTQGPGGGGINVPEPATILIMGSGLAMIAGFRRRRKTS